MLFSLSFTSHYYLNTMFFNIIHMIHLSFISVLNWIQLEHLCFFSFCFFSCLPLGCIWGVGQHERWEKHIWGQLPTKLLNNNTGVPRGCQRVRVGHTPTTVKRPCPRPITGGQALTLSIKAPELTGSVQCSGRGDSKTSSQRTPETNAWSLQRPYHGHFTLTYRWLFAF